MEELVFGRRYRVTEKIGAGGMADVYKAVDDVLGRTVAVKVLHERYSAEPNFIARFRQEAQAAANLSHPNIVNMYDWGHEGETYYIVMEYVNGPDLKSIVTEKGPIDPLKAAEYGAQVCSALAVAHGYDIIHRDIKPHNIAIASDGSVKVMDFGIARAGNSTMTQTGSVLGTAQYISPEQAQGKPLTPASDLYSLGITLYEAVTGQLPFTADTPVATALMQVNSEPVPPRQLRASIPPALEAVILRALRKDPAERYASASEMRADLKRVASGEPAIGGAYGGALMDHTSVLPAIERSATPVTAGPQIHAIPEKRRISPWVWVGIVAAVLLAGLGIAYAMGAFGGGGVIVPPVTGLTEDQARLALTNAGLTPGEVTTENSDEVELGLVIRQDPPAGTEAEEGARVDFVVSLGVELLTVPNLTDMPESEAIDALAAAGFDYDRSVDEFNTEIDKGNVVRTDPVADSQQPRGTTVVLYVSAGVEQVKVPDIEGKPLAEANAALEAIGLKSKVNEVFSDTVAKGSVISQRPSADALVETGSTVTLEVSKGPEVILVPEVVNKTEAEAKSILEGAKLKAKVTYVDSLEDGIVINQFPIPGASASPGDVVEIEVGKVPSP